MSLQGTIGNFSGNFCEVCEFLAYNILKVCSKKKKKVLKVTSELMSYVSMVKREYELD